MFKALMAVQWKWTRVAALFGLLLGFAIPLVSVQSLRAFTQYEMNPIAVIQLMQQFGILYAVLAAGVGLAMALLAWGADHKGRHIYALSLPISRARYAGMRFGAGSIFLLVPTIGVLLGCLFAVAMAPIPDGLHAYPLSLSARFFLSSFVSFAIFFAIAASTQRAARVVLGGIGALIVLGIVMAGMEVGFDLFEWAGNLLFSAPGLLSVFTGRWMLIDV